MQAIIDKLAKHGVYVEVKDGELAPMFLDTAPESIKAYYRKHETLLKKHFIKKAHHDGGLKPQSLMDKIKATICPRCQYHNTCEHGLASTTSFFEKAFLEYMIIPKDGFYLVHGTENRIERYKAELCELAVLRALWTSCPKRCRYCQYASTDEDGDWWCSYSQPGDNPKYIVFKNLEFVKRCPKTGKSRNGGPSYDSLKGY